MLQEPPTEKKKNYIIKSVFFKKMVMRVGLKIVDYNCSIFSIYVVGSIAQNPILVTIDGEKASKIP